MTGERGVFVALVGPDGVGKTSVAAELVTRTDGRYFHFRPPLWRDWTTPSPGEVVVAPTPRRTGIVVSWLRLGKALVTFWLGYLTSVRPEVRRGGTVIADRWAYGYLVKPAKLGVSLGKRVCRAIVRIMPQPDAVIALVADPVVIHRRKLELSVSEAAEEVDAWASLPISQLIRVDTERPVTEVVDEILAALGG